MQIINLPINTKSLYLNILNDNPKGHTATVNTPIKQGNSLNKQLEQIFKIPKQLSFKQKNNLISEMLKNSKSIIKINNVFVFDKISVNGIKLNNTPCFCLYIKEEVDDKKKQYGRIKFHYPTSFHYKDREINIDNKSILNQISEVLLNYAFVVNSFQYDFDTDYLNFKVTIIGENQIPYSKVFIKNKGVGNKFSNIFNEYANSYDMEIMSLRKKYGKDVDAASYENYINKERIIANDVCTEFLKNQKYQEIRNISEKYPDSLYDFDYEENGTTKYCMLFFTATSKKYFNISSKRLRFINDFKEKTSIILITNIEYDPKVNVLKVEDLNNYSSTINSIMMKEE